MEPRRCSLGGVRRDRTSRVNARPQLGYAVWSAFRPADRERPVGVRLERRKLRCKKQLRLLDAAVSGTMIPVRLGSVRAVPSPTSGELMHRGPKISVVIPCYNEEEVIRR